MTVSAWLPALQNRSKFPWSSTPRCKAQPLPALIPARYDGRSRCALENFRYMHLCHFFYSSYNSWYKIVQTDERRHGWGKMRRAPTHSACWGIWSNRTPIYVCHLLAQQLSYSQLSCDTVRGAYCFTTVGSLKTRVLKIFHAFSDIQVRDLLDSHLSLTMGGPICFSPSPSVFSFSCCCVHQSSGGFLFPAFFSPSIGVQFLVGLFLFFSIPIWQLTYHRDVKSLRFSFANDPSNSGTFKTW